MPVVPPMVSAATGALLVSHLPAGQLRLTMLLACYAMFGLSLIASLVVITQLWRRPGPLRGRAGGDGANGVDRARPARAVHHRREPARRGRPSSASAAIQHRGDGGLQAYFTRRAQAAGIVTGALSLASEAAPPAGPPGQPPPPPAAPPAFRAAVLGLVDVDALIRALAGC
jgi:hypothetical protein